MNVYTLEQAQLIPASPDAVWKFISSPTNLSKITPKYMGFEITSKSLPTYIQPGLTISYTVSPLFGIKVKWISEITEVEELKLFVDEQRVGPYDFWRHEHYLLPDQNGVLMRDIVRYTPPLGWLGDLANRFLIRRKLDEIFDYRRKALVRIFGEDSTV